MTRGTALVRRPSSRLADGIVTHIAPTPVDVVTAQRQHEAYRAALADAGWTVHEVATADECPDSVFVEDTVVVCDDLAVLTRPGTAARRPEVDGTETVVRALGLDVVRIEPPGTLEGGDVLQVGSTVYVGRGDRTDDAGIRQLAGYLATRGGKSFPWRCATSCTSSPRSRLSPTARCSHCLRWSTRRCCRPFTPSRKKPGATSSLSAATVCSSPRPLPGRPPGSGIWATRPSSSTSASTKSSRAASRA